MYSTVLGVTNGLYKMMHLELVVGNRESKERRGNVSLEDLTEKEASSCGSWVG